MTVDPRHEPSSDAVAPDAGTAPAAPPSDVPNAAIAATGATGTTGSPGAAGAAAADGGTTSEGTSSTTAIPPLTPTAEVDAIAAAGIAPAGEAAAARSTRWLAFLVGLRRVGLVFLAIVFFAGGAALGYAAFVASRVPPPIPGDVGTPGVQPPPVVQEFITALGRNDSDAIRSALPPQPHKDLTDLMTSYGIQNLDGTEVLGTLVDGTRSATEIVMKGARTNGNPFAINLVILADGGQIKGFR